MNISFPDEVLTLLHALEAGGFEAYAVGGCVRDALRRVTPHDWDLCTSATPEEMLRCLRPFRVLNTGLRHGTVTVVLERGSYEVTTFRIDGAYSDGRRPDSVRFTRALRDDLARRDFTINAMACHPAGGLIDPFQGWSDLREKRIRCVGEPDQRFREDGLRLLRALRFASCLGFSLEAGTEKSLRKNKALLQGISAERLYAETVRLLRGASAAEVLCRNADVFSVFLPPFSPEGAAAAARLQDTAAQFAALFGDRAQEALARLKAPGAVRREAAMLALYRGAALTPTPRDARRWLSRLGAEGVRRLAAFQGALRPGGPPAAFLRCVDDALADGACYTLSALAVNGDDLRARGLSGRQIGEALHALLDLVIDGQAPNDRAALLDRVTGPDGPAAPLTERHT